MANSAQATKRARQAENNRQRNASQRSMLRTAIKKVVAAIDAADADAAKEAGADIIGMEDLAEDVKKGNMDFDVVIASPDAMRVVGALGQILGPRGLMPNPKVGTVAQDVATAVRNAKAGQVRYRTDKAGIIHCPIGKVDFESGKLKENLEALLADLQKAKPPRKRPSGFDRSPRRPPGTVRSVSVAAGRPQPAAAGGSLPPRVPPRSLSEVGNGPPAGPGWRRPGDPPPWRRRAGR